MNKQTKQARATALQYEVDLKVIDPSLANETASKQKQLKHKQYVFQNGGPIVGAAYEIMKCKTDRHKHMNIFFVEHNLLLTVVSTQIEMLLWNIITYNAAFYTLGR